MTGQIPEVPEPLARRTAAAVVKALDLLDEVSAVVQEMDRLDHAVDVFASAETVLDVDEASHEMATAAGASQLRDLVQAIAEPVIANTASTGGKIPTYDERKALRARFAPAAARDVEVEDARRRWIGEGCRPSGRPATRAEDGDDLVATGRELLVELLDTGALIHNIALRVCDLDTRTWPPMAS